VHDRSKIDFGSSKPERINVHEIPHGPFDLPEPRKSRNDVRKDLRFEEDDLVFLSFGQIRDGKNLDLFLRAMPETPPRVKLLVAGRSDSGSQKTPSYYRELAESTGVSGRCQWLIRYINDEEIAEIFDAADIVLLTYSKAFVSASGVLNIAVEREKPVLASGGDGPLKTAVTNYPIGLWMDPLNEDSIVSAIAEFSKKEQLFEFSSYLEAHSWCRNAMTVKEAVIGTKNDN
jgi:glycosyltransferase involved in cell wall biosynthesis